jgi:hydrogenase nickel incorporation protein HypB
MCATCGCSSETHDHHAHAHAHAHAHGEDHHHDHPHVHAHGDQHHHDHLHVHAHGDQHHHDHPHSERDGRSGNLERAVLAKNDALADRNRSSFAERLITVLNLVGAPGSGKTALLERTIAALGAQLPIQVIEGDQETTRDADRIRAAGATVVQINTGSGCHLDARMVGQGLAKLSPPAKSLLFIENVGNLVCPALFDLGERAKILVASVTEGDDKPIKYPHMYRASAVLLLNKIDLLGHVPFDMTRHLEHTKRVNPRLELIPVSALRGDGLGLWFAWLKTHHAGS